MARAALGWPFLFYSENVMARKDGKGTLKERLLRKIKESPSGCWEWQGTSRQDGYPLIWKDGKSVRANQATVSQIQTGKRWKHLPALIVDGE